MSKRIEELEIKVQCLEDRIKILEQRLAHHMGLPMVPVVDLSSDIDYS